MIDQAFPTLEFASLLALFRRLAQTDNGRARFDELQPLNRLDQLQSDLRAAGEMIELRREGTRLSFSGIADTTSSISRLRIEGTALEPTALLDLARLCDQAIEARTALLAVRDVGPTLFEIVAGLPVELKKLAASINKKILPGGEIDDRASPELARVRRELAGARSRITRSLENLMRRHSEAIQEELVTVRNDRFVIPVRADHQGRIKGVAHGSSSSGATIFVEPLETIEANNELQLLRESEQREIAEILFNLSEELRQHLVDIEHAAAGITELDFINAKAVFAERFDCVVPNVAGSADVSSALNAGANFATFELVDARHPLLEENLRGSNAKVVPVSFKLDSEHAVMVISGANAGGKTVVLKTAGLLSIMALSGLPVPARHAEVPFYRSVLADIGDQQSLAANLSTFTSHVANIALMIKSCEPPALVLLDEVGTGTDPEEGSALGVAVVNEFKQRGAQVMATTHYSGLKMYAASETGVLNASVEFDEKTLQPTYRLLVGIAGSSSGLEIARRFGIPDAVANNAISEVKQSSRNAAEYLLRIKREAEAAETMRQALAEERAAVAEKFASLDLEARKRESDRQAEFQRHMNQAVHSFEKLSRELVSKISDRAERAKVEREAERRAAEIKREAQRIAREAQQQHKTAQARTVQGREGGLPPQLRSVRVVRDGKLITEGTAQAKEPVQVEEKEAAPAVFDRDIKIGDRVRLLSFGSTGIVDQIRGNDVEVRVGSLRLREQLSNLQLIEPARGPGPTTKEGSESDKTRRALRTRAATTELHLHGKAKGSEAGTGSELNLIGKKTDEAVDLADKFLDEAFLNGVSEVRIIHGHGTGALRKAISEFLADHPHVERFASAPPEHGGAGATVVVLRT
jgi:DNA mismatch repair protein MutS2